MKIKEFGPQMGGVPGAKALGSANGYYVRLVQKSVAKYNIESKIAVWSVIVQNPTKHWNDVFINYQSHMLIPEISDMPFYVYSVVQTNSISVGHGCLSAFWGNIVGLLQFRINDDLNINQWK